MPESVFQQIQEALRARLAVIANHELRDRDPAAHLEQLKQASERILELQRQLPPNTPGRLRHFLEGCSYQKALAFLEEMEQAGG
jgi:hypothetical protein